jgi:hypothetical protein
LEKIPMRRIGYLFVGLMAVCGANTPYAIAAASPGPARVPAEIALAKSGRIDAKVKPEMQLAGPGKQCTG